MVIGIYTRKSVYRDNSDSIDVQEQICRDYAKILYQGQPLEFVVYNQDEGYSGGSTQRPGFQALMRDVEANLLQTVMVYRLDRIARNVPAFAAVFEIFQKHQVAFVSTKESFDTSTPIGRTVMYILAAFAQLERENVSERVTDSMLALGSSGKWTGGNLPAGMRSVRKAVGSKEHSYLEVDPQTVSQVKLLYALLLEGYSVTRLERYCKDHGIKSPRGKFFSASQIHNIITNPVYCQNSPAAYAYFKEQGCRLPDQSLFDGRKGLIGYGRTKIAAASQRRQQASFWHIAVGLHAPVISADNWIAAQKRLGLNKMYHRPKYEFGLLKGMLRCSCGSRMDIRTYRKNDRFFSYYYCARMARQGKNTCASHYIRVEAIDNAFLLQLKRLCPTLSAVFPHEPSVPAPDPSALETEAARLQASILNLTNVLTQAMDSPAAAYIVAQIEELDAQKKILQKNLQKAQSLAAVSASHSESRETVFAHISFLLAHFQKISYPAKNELLRKLIKSCTFDGKNLHVIL